MNILNYKLDTTNELLTARIGLLAIAHTINTLDLSNIPNPKIEIKKTQKPQLV